MAGRSFSELARSRPAADSVQWRGAPGAELVQMGDRPGARTLESPGRRREHRTPDLGRDRQAGPDPGARQTPPTPTGGALSLPIWRTDYRVAAISLSGMGASDWRETYSFEIFARETRACAEVAGLYHAAEKPIFHRPFLRRLAGLPCGDDLSGVDARCDPGRHRLRRPATGRRRLSQSNDADQANRVYPSLAEALGRFRLMAAAGLLELLYIADFIARRSLKRVPLPEGEGEGGGEGWTWRFDPCFGASSTEKPWPPWRPRPATRRWCTSTANIPKSCSATPSKLSILPARTRQIVIPDSEHHIMVDQPLAPGGGAAQRPGVLARRRHRALAGAPEPSHHAMGRGF